MPRGDPDAVAATRICAGKFAMLEIGEVENTTGQ